MPGPGNLPTERSEQPEDGAKRSERALTGSPHLMGHGFSLAPAGSMENPACPDHLQEYLGHLAYPGSISMEDDSVTKAVWNGAVIAESEACEIVEGNRYFPPDSVRREHLRASDKHTVCHWKGVASYYDVVVGGQVNKDAAWYYPETKEAAQNIRGYIAFWHGVRVED